MISKMFLYILLQHRFAVVMWKKDREDYWEKKPTAVQAEAGIQIKVVGPKSAKGPSSALRNALWKTGDTTNGVSVYIVYDTV